MFLAGAVIGFAIGVTFGAVKLGIERHDMMGAAIDYQKQIYDLKQMLLTKEEATEECKQVILGDGAVTVLADQNHPYGGKYQTVFGAALTLPDDGNPALPYGPVWVIHRRVTPQVEDGALGGVYTHIFPDGKSDGWHVPMRAAQIQ